MRNRLLLLTLLIATTSGVVQLVSRESSVAVRDSVPLPGLKADDLNSLGSLLFELAAERHANHSERHEVWVLTMHEGQSIRKYTDHKYIVLSLPVLEPRNRIALCAYVRNYNYFNECAADVKALSGNYKEAREFYQLILHFDRCGGLARESIERKLELVEKMEKGESLEANRKQLAELYVPVAAHMKLNEVERIRPTVVTNLLQIRP